MLAILFSPFKAIADSQQLQQDIRRLDNRLAIEQKRAVAARDEVRALEKKLGIQTRKIYTLSKKIKKLDDKLKKTESEKEKTVEQWKAQKKGLSQQMQALYSAGEQSHLRLLLKQDDPSDIGRTIKYFEYLNKSRIKKIDGIKETLTTLDRLKSEIEKDNIALHKLRKKQISEQKSSKKTLELREQVYKKIRKKVNSKKQRLKILKKKEAKLQEAIDRLVAKTKKETKLATARTKIKGKKPVKKSTPRSEKIVGANQRFIANQKFSSLRGKLSWPVKGKLIHAYGERRNEKQRWKGVVIASPGGRKVKAIARGKVEFSGWFNGYGYLVIIRHDNNYRSLYGYNRAIYVRTGQVVKGGTTIASVGNSGGQQRNALYFEIRKGTQPRNPAKWCR